MKPLDHSAGYMEYFGVQRLTHAKREITRVHSVHAGSHPRDWLVTYEKTPKYFYHPPVPYRIKALLPDVRLIMTLRDPVLATCNLFNHNTRVRWGGEAETDQVWAQDFEGWVHLGINMHRNYTACRNAFFQELAAKPTDENVSTPCSPVPRNLNDMWSCDVEMCQAIEETLMVRCGEPTTVHTLGGGPFGTDSFIPLYSYSESWRRWTRVFPRQQLLVVVMEDFIKSPLVPQLLNIRRFLGLDDESDQLEAPQLQQIRRNLWGAKLRDVLIDDALLNGTRPLSDGFPQQRKSCSRAFPRTVEVLRALFIEQVPSMPHIIA